MFISNAKTSKHGHLSTQKTVQKEFTGAHINKESSITRSAGIVKKELETEFHEINLYEKVSQNRSRESSRYRGQSNN